MNVLLSSFVFLVACASAALSQPPAGGEPPRRDGPDRREGGFDRRGPGGPGGSAGMMRPPEGFEKLSEEERKLMREAFSKAWSDPGVVEARDKALQANEQMRRVLHETMKRNDAKVAAILEKMKPPYPLDERGLPQMPAPESPEFARMAMARLGAEALAVTRPGRHEETRRLHERIMQSQRMKEAIEGLQKAPPGERVERFRQLRELYRETVRDELAKFNKMREEREKDGEAKKAPTAPAPAEPKP